MSIMLQNRMIRVPRSLLGADYYINFNGLGANENPIYQAGRFTNADVGTGGNSPLAPNNSMQIALSSDGTERLCYETIPTDGYDDSLSFVPGYAGNQRIVATAYKKVGYTPTGANHELALHLGTHSYGFANKRSVEIGFNYAGGYFVAGFDGDLVSWDAPPTGVMSSPWSAGATGLGGAPVSGDVYRAEHNRAAKTIKCWQNSDLVIDLQWNDTSMVDATAQAVLNALGDGIGLGALRRIGDGSSIAGALGWRDALFSSTIFG